MNGYVVFDIIVGKYNFLRGLLVIYISELDDIRWRTKRRTID